MIVPLPILFGNLLLVLVMHRCCNVTSCVGAGHPNWNWKHQLLLALSFFVIILYVLLQWVVWFVLCPIFRKKLQPVTRMGYLEPLEEGDSLLL